MEIYNLRNSIKSEKDLERVRQLLKRDNNIYVI
jgi:hypothetical protein